MQFAARHSLHLHRLVPTSTAQFCVVVVRGVPAEGRAELVPGQEVYIYIYKYISLRIKIIRWRSRRRALYSMGR
eukprot:6287122-Alexandrium_andersonii.AAC.1